MDSGLFPSHRHTFLTLPLEIRLQIYDLALVRRRDDGTVGSIYTVIDIGDRQVPLSPALLGSNRQIHAEAAPALYGTNIFNFAEPIDLEVWLTQIGSINLGSVRHLQLRVTIGIRKEKNPQFYAMLHPFDPDHLTLEIQHSSQYWSLLFRKLFLKALNLRTFCVRFEWTFGFTGFGTDPEQLVAEIGKLKGLERIDMEGMVAQKWVDSLREVNTAKVLENGRETGL